jgi:hypothetical protein
MTSMKNEPGFQAPNLFELQGYNFQLTYATSSFTGEPRLSYITPTENREFSGDEISMESTGLGEIVTVKLKANLADEGTETLTLLVPVVLLTADVQSVAVQTLVIFSSLPGFVIPQAGQSQRYIRFAHQVRLNL